MLDNGQMTIARRICLPMCTSFDPPNPLEWAKIIGDQVASFHCLGRIMATIIVSQVMLVGYDKYYTDTE